MKFNPLSLNTVHVAGPIIFALKDLFRFHLRLSSDIAHNYWSNIASHAYRFDDSPLIAEPFLQPL
jgi:hypothetical protein